MIGRRLAPATCGHIYRPRHHDLMVIAFAHSLTDLLFPIRFPQSSAEAFSDCQTIWRAYNSGCSLGQ